ncbi:MAG: aspartate-semialdehyde dehydrogenase [Thermoprotei archaeon]|nr:MAG: aspartate-semialdehyde dehydrogenase [Thermoprotei archaeon]RLF00757.1 MAG: aspartate-semialdehyde dehydrogenase [Thermoprotei archaeon]
MADRLKVGVLGATGLVGQRFIQLLHDHPWFQLEVISASAEKAGMKYSEATRWIWSTPLPSSVADMRLCKLSPEKFKGLDIVFSALPSQIAGGFEEKLAKMGLTVVSNASPMRLEDDIPLVNPEINPEHLKLLEVQRRTRGWKGVIVKNPNCTTAILTLSLKPLLDEFGLKRVRVATMQALSGAGYRGVYSMDIMDNIIPFIKNEEDKVRDETRKILGSLKGERVKWLDIGVSATCCRVPVLEGHLEAVFVELEEKPSDLSEVIKVLETFEGLPQKLKLPTAPDKPIIVRSEVDRPQPRLDRMAYRGMAVTVGRIRWDEATENGLKYLVLGSNTIRGAAGAAVLIAELMKAKGII